jgi:hypothetical protein
MNRLSGQGEKQHYENASSIPPVELCVPTSPRPRVLLFPTPLCIVFHVAPAQFLAKIYGQ